MHVWMDVCMYVLKYYTEYYAASGYLPDNTNARCFSTKWLQFF